MFPSDRLGDKTCQLLRPRPDTGYIVVTQPQRRRRWLAFHHQQLTEPLPRERDPQVEGHDQLFEPISDVRQRGLIAIGEALHQASVSQKCLPARGIVPLKLSEALQEDDP